MGSAKKRGGGGGVSGSTTTNESETKRKNGGWTFGAVLVFLTAAVAAVAAAALHFGDVSEDVLKAFNSGSESLVDEVIARARAEVDIMSDTASTRERFEVADVTDLPYVEYLLEESQIRKDEQAMGVTWKNFYTEDLTIYWVPPHARSEEDWIFSGVLRRGTISSTNTYNGHVFAFKNTDTGIVKEKLVMSDRKHMLLLGPDEDDVETRNSKEFRKALQELEFRTKYFEKHGIPWLSHYPVTPPALPFWPANFIGQTHRVRSFVGYFEDEETQSEEPVDLKIVVVSIRPRVMLIENLLSPFEVQHILKLGESVLARSRVGNGADGFQSDTRTSDNGWISRKRSFILDEVYERFADALNYTEIVEGSEGNVEQLQFVRYRNGQHYAPHHDFGYSGKPEQRFSTLFMYLQNSEEGGATSFPKAFNGRGIKVKPPSGSAALFYSMLEDGNGDDLSLHSGMVVDRGEKVAANLWSWSPKNKFH